MLKLKNKLRLGTSSSADPPPDILNSYPSSSGNSIDSFKVLSDKLQDTYLSSDKTIDAEDKIFSSNGHTDDEHSDNSRQSPEGTTITSDHTMTSNHSDTNTNLDNANSKNTSTSANTAPSKPGLLKVKIYNSANVKLPIPITNNKQVLKALATNARNSYTQQQLSTNLAKANSEVVDDSEDGVGLNSSQDDDGDLLSGDIATNLLPANITIPNEKDLVKSLLYLTIEFDNNMLMIEPQKGTVNSCTWNQVISFDVTKNLSQGNVSTNDRNILKLNLFIRLPSLLIPKNEKIDYRHHFTFSGNNMGDLLIGSVSLPLDLSRHSESDRLINHEFLHFISHNVNDTTNNQFGQIMITVDFKPLPQPHLSIDDFDLLKVIGKGSFGKVMQVIKKDTKQIYALKTLRKQHIISKMEVTHTLAERTVLARISNPFIVPLKFSFQSPEKLYLVLSFINGGELFWHLGKEGKFSLDRSRFYIAELLTALESLHELNIIYRDLKPENILLDYQGHIALCDFGLCKLNMSSDDKTNTFCGTAEYLAPELLLNQGYTRSVDWWTLGTLLYEMLTGLPPFFDEDVPTMYRNILQNPLKFPLILEGTEAQDLLMKLLQKDPSKRLSDANQIKSHRFFRDIDWEKLLSKSYLPPFKPDVDNLLDTSNFDQMFTNETPQDSVVDDFLSGSVQKQFGGWTFNGDPIL